MPRLPIPPSPVPTATPRTPSLSCLTPPIPPPSHPFLAPPCPSPLGAAGPPPRLPVLLPAAHRRLEHAVRAHHVRLEAVQLPALPAVLPRGLRPRPPGAPAPTRLLLTARRLCEAGRSALQILSRSTAFTQGKKHHADTQNEHERSGVSVRGNEATVSMGPQHTTTKANGGMPLVHECVSLLACAGALRTHRGQALHNTRLSH